MFPHECDNRCKFLRCLVYPTPREHAVRVRLTVETLDYRPEGSEV